MPGTHCCFFFGEPLQGITNFDSFDTQEMAFESTDYNLLRAPGATIKVAFFNIFLALKGCGSWSLCRWQPLGELLHKDLMVTYVPVTVLRYLAGRSLSHCLRTLKRRFCKRKEVSIPVIDGCKNIFWLDYAEFVSIWTVRSMLTLSGLKMKGNEQHKNKNNIYHKEAIISWLQKVPNHIRPTWTQSNFPDSTATY